MGRADRERGYRAGGLVANSRRDRLAGMPDEKYVTESEFKKILAGQLQLHMDLQVNSVAIQQALIARGVISLVDIEKQRQALESLPTTVALRKSLAEKLASMSIDDMLRLFVGPIQ